MQYSQKNMFPCEYCKISKKSYIDEHLRTDASEITLRNWLLRIRTFFLDSCFQIHPDHVMLQKYQSLSVEPRFRMFIINGYDSKSKRL